MTVTVSIGDTSYAQAQGTLTLDSAAVFTGSGRNFTEGYLQFAITGAASTETLGLRTVLTVDTTLNAVSIVGSTVYLGTGSGYAVLGSVDPTLNGLNGHALRINLEDVFQNGNFNIGTNGDTSITGWTTGLNRLQLNGVDQIAGQATPIDITYGPNNTTADLTTGGAFVPTANLSDYAGLSSADLAIRLTTGNASVAQPYGTIRDACVYSNSTVTLQAGDSLSFDWKALSAADAYDAYGYIIDVNTSHTVTILDSTGTSYGQETPWATVTHTIASGEAGTYRFVFVAGSYDLTGGQYLGAALMIDDVSVSQANPAAVGDSVIQALARAVTYRYADVANSLAGSTRTVTMTVVDGASTTFSDTGAITIASANHPPSITSGATANFAENATTTVYTAIGNDRDGDTLAFTLGGADAALFNINAATGAVTFKTAPDFETPRDNGANNIYDITVTASDGSVSSDAQAVKITVTNVNEFAPSITSAAATSFAENGTTYVYNAFGSDPDAGTTLTYVLGGADAALFNINAATGAVTFKTPPDFETPRDNGANNIYDITVTASDGSFSSAAQAVAITITDMLEYYVKQGNNAAANINAQFYSGPLQGLGRELQY